MINRFFTIRSLVILLLIFSFIFGAIRVYTVFARTPDYNTVQVKKDAITQSVSASGDIKSQEEVELSFKINGRVTWIKSKVGDQVKKWQAIAGLDTEDLDIALRQAKNTFRDKEAIVEKIHDDLKDHQNDETFAQKVTRTTAEVAKDNAYDGIKEAERAFKDAVVSSPIAGTLVYKDTEVGETVKAFAPVFRIADLSKLVFVARVGESDIPKVSINQKTNVSLDAFPNKKFTGKVIEVGIASTTTTGVKSYPVKIALDDLTQVKLDMSGEAEIISQSKPDALTVPQIVIQEKEGKKYVETLEGDEVKQKEVTTGIKGTDGTIEILSGLNTGDKVIIPAKKP